MATITGYTKAKMLSIINLTLKSATVVGDNLVFTRNDDSTFIAGNVRGPQGDPGTGGGGSAPTGAVMVFAAATAPTGWLLARGGLVLKTDYPALYDIILDNYKLDTDTDTTRFRLPDLRDRVPVGASVGKPLYLKGGAESTTIATAHLPAHNHTMVHNHDINTRNGAGPSTAYVSGAVGAGTVTLNPTAILDAGGVTGPYGTAVPTPFPTQDPYIGMHYIIKT